MQGCKHSGCDTAKVKALGYCSAHYSRVSSGKDMDPPVRKKSASDSERFWEKVEKTETCWNWTASSVRGYGVFRIGGRTSVAHRISYVWAKGEIPEGAQLDHMCHNRSCVNPAHLRFADHILNGQNRSTSNSNSKSGVRGVYWCNTYGHWIAKAMINRKPHHIGIFHDLDMAAKAVAEWRSENMPYSLMDKRKVS
jgi:hypothetical protein